MSGFFGRALKSNPFLYRSVITGIISLSIESIFSRANNISVYTLLRKEYSQHFGFNEEEVTEILERSMLTVELPEVRKWYNGYKFGDLVVYNPWSIVNFVKTRSFGPYWVNTSDDQLFKYLLVHLSLDVKEDLEMLLKGETIEKYVDEYIITRDFGKAENSIWSLLVSTGYLKVIEQCLTQKGLKCKLGIPNYELRRLYRQIIEEWFSSESGTKTTLLNILFLQKFLVLEK